MSGKSFIRLTCFLVSVLRVSTGPSISLEAAKALDTDGSGKVELNEITSFARSHGLDVQAVQNEFASFDRDQDGTLDISELNATLGDGQATAEKVTLRTRSPPNVNEVMSQANSQSPQSISQPPQAMIKVHEQNAGALSAGGYSQEPAATSATAAPTSATATPSSAPANPVGGESAAADVTAAQSMIKALDTDGSGVVEKSEVDAFAKSQGLSAAETAEEFKDLDKNHDGQLDSSEISSTVAQYTSTSAPVTAAEKPVVQASPPPATKTALAPAAAKVPTPAIRTSAPVQNMAPAVGPSATETFTPIEPSANPSEPEEIAKTLALNTQQADRTVAQLFALKASNDLAKRDKDLEEAKMLEQKAAALRGQASKVAEDAIKSAEQAAKKVGRGIMEKALEEAQNLENQAKKVEGRAASINAKAKVAMAQAIEAQTSASKAVADLVTATTNKV